MRFRIGNDYQGSGRAEVYMNGQWGTICNIYWEDVDASTFCRQLPDYVGGFEASPAVVGEPNQPIWMSRVECRGKEKSFLDCEVSWDPLHTRRCFHNHDAGVMCFKSGEEIGRVVVNCNSVFVQVFKQRFVWFLHTIYIE